jgi:hypothetical protein
MDIIRNNYMESEITWTQYKVLVQKPRIVQLDCTNRVLGSACSLISKILSLDRAVLVDVINLNALSVKTSPVCFKNRILAKWASGSPITGPFRTRGTTGAFLKCMKGMLNTHKSHGVAMYRRVRINPRRTGRGIIQLVEHDILQGHNIENYSQLIESL